MYATEPDQVDSSYEIPEPGNVTLLPPQRRAKDKIEISIEDAQAWLACGVLSKTAYVYLILLIKFDGNTNVDIRALSNCLSCALAVGDNDIKKIEFTEEDTLNELAKLNKKGALSIQQTAIQLKLNL